MHVRSKRATHEKRRYTYVSGTVLWELQNLNTSRYCFMQKKYKTTNVNSSNSPAKYINKISKLSQLWD